MFDYWIRLWYMHFNRHSNMFLNRLLEKNGKKEKGLEH